VNITELPFDSDNYSTAHPVLSPDEKTMYFVSDMPGTMGLSDLFKIQKMRTELLVTYKFGRYQY
jgi:Tol biopolymer transport system component